ncbi:MAG: peptidase T-like protein [Clostridiales bacterium]|jgi:tripeptide aminopeptidase|nr:peptidase T-like protein [Clostridiales bacterium]
MINVQRIIDEFQELVAIDSPTFGERQIADVLKNKLEAIGFQVTEDEVGKLFGSDCGNLYGYLEGEISGDSLLFSAHMDTVTPAHGKKAIVHSDGRITSAGDTVLGADDVAGLTSILEAIRSIREEGLPHRSIEVLFPVAEEIYTKGSSSYDYTTIKSKEAYVLDLSGEVGRAAYTAPTILSFKAIIKGKAAHAGFSPEEGIHSIAIAAKAIAKMKLGRIDEETTFNIGTITGGEATNIIPENCKLEGEIRSLKHEKAIGYLMEIKELLEKEVSDFGAILEWEEKINCYAYETDINGHSANRYREACEKLGIKPDFVKTFGGSDLNAFARNGIVGLVLTNAMNKVHSCEEFTQVEELIKSTEIVKELMLSEI